MRGYRLDQPIKKHIAALDAARAASGPRAHRRLISRYSAPPNCDPRKNIVTKKIAEQPSRLARAPRTTNRPASARCSSASARCAARDRTRALVTIADDGASSATRAEKERRALLDYDDLIDKTLTLFARSSAAWVHYKLDLGIDHVLIDEAQDTSPKQWEIVAHHRRRILRPAARGRTCRRTIFAVGDEKQSIFSFQGAAPQRLRRDAARCSSGSSIAPELRLAIPAFRTLVPLRRERARLRSTACSPRARCLCQRDHRRRRRAGAHRAAGRRARRGRNLGH